MYKIWVNNQYQFEVSTVKGRILVNDKPLEADIKLISPGIFHIIYMHRSFSAELIDLSIPEKRCSVRINSNIYSLTVTDQFDELLSRLGMDNMNKTKVSDLKAPMPGMVLKVLAAAGEEVKKDSGLLVLEAMKMENIIKAPADLVIRSVKVNPGDKVEKNQVMMVFN